MTDATATGSALGRVARGSLLLIGVTVFLVGLAAALVPDAAEPRAVTALVEALGSDYLVVAFIGLGAAALALLVTLWRRLSGVDEAVPPAVEGVQSAPHPGSAFDRSFHGSFGRLAPSTRDRLREAAIRSVMRTRHCSRDAAARRVSEGTWTDDAVAAELLADHRGVLTRLRTLGPGTGTVERTIGAIEGIETDTPAEGQTTDLGPDEGGAR